MGLAVLVGADYLVDVFGAEVVLVFGFFKVLAGYNYFSTVNGNVISFSGVNLTDGQEYLLVVEGNEVQFQMAKIMAVSDAPQIIILRQ